MRKAILLLTISIFTLNCVFAQAKKEKAEKPQKEKAVKAEKAAKENTAKVEKEPKPKRDNSPEAKEARKNRKKTQTETRKLNVKRYLKLGDRFYAESAYYTAAEYYKEVVLSRPENRYANYWLAMSLLKSRDYEKAEVFFEKFGSIKQGEKDKESKWKEEDDKLFNKYHYFYADALHRNGKYEAAIQEYGKFKRSYDKEDKDRWTKLANNGIKGSELGLNPHSNKIKAKRLSTSISRSYNELSPMQYNENTLFYSSLPSDTLVFQNKKKQGPKYQIYTASLVDGTWDKPTLVNNEDINTPKYDVGNGSFNVDKTRFYFTKCTEMEDYRSLCNIFVADVKGGKFSNVERLPEPINYKERYTSTQPAVRTSTDGREIIYFVSDREGGKGGLDIWFTSRIKSGEYTAPKLLGGAINSAGDEVTPYWDEFGKTLYFSSNGLPGFGGFDIFSTKELSDYGWEEPQNLGNVLNTGYDELYYNINSDQSGGFFTSNRPGGRALNSIESASDDIFAWELFNYAVTGIVFRDGGAEAGPVEGATFKLYRKKADGTRELVSVDSSQVRAAAQLGEGGVGTQVPGGVKTQAGGAKPLQGAQSEGGYFFKLRPDEDYEVEVIRPGFKPTVEFVSTKNLPMEDTINKNLGVKKSAYVVYGNVVEDGNPDVKLGDVMFTVIEESGSGIQRTIMNGKTEVGALDYAVDLEKDKDYKLIFRRSGYFTKTVQYSTKKLGDKDSVMNNVAMTKLELNKEYTLKNILYEFGKATLTETSKEVLDTLYAVLVENPTFEIELSAHTDAIGSDAANLKLSQDRAESCVNYLISKGIAKERLKPVGYGESRPKAPNQTEDGKDNPEGRALNRRTEFKILKG